MEEVDGIIIATLRELGSNVDAEVVSLHHFSPAMMVEACVRCLKTINNDFSSPLTLPEAMSAKYRMCSSLANACQELGYQAEIGYQTFLYPSIKDWRKLLMFLLEKLPREEAKATDEPMGSAALLNRTIAAKLQIMLKTPWMPLFTRGHKTSENQSQWALQTGLYQHKFHAVDVQAPTGAADLTCRIPKDLKRYYAQYLPYVTVQPPIKDDLMASILEKNTIEFSAQQEWENEWNQAGLASRLSEQEYRSRKKQRLQKRVAEQLRQGVQVAQQSGQFGTTTASGSASSDFEQFLAGFADKSAHVQGKGSRFQHTEKLQFTQEDETSMTVPDGPAKPSEEELAQQREQEIGNLQDELAQLIGQVEGMQLDIKKFTSNMQQLKETAVTMEAECGEMEADYQTQKKTYDLLPNADENIEKLQNLVSVSTEKLSKLAAQWEEHRAPLITKYRELKEEDSQITAQTTDLLEEIKIVRERMKEVAEEARHKDDLYKQLVAEYERMSKDLNRSAYTKRIMEIVGNIRKQKTDINKVLNDTRQVQKEINQLSGKLERVFVVTEEQIYKDAKKDEARRTAYKYLASLRENSKQVVEAIKETGQIKREIKELDEQIENETGKRIAANLEKITADYQQVKQENAQLLTQLKKSN